MIEQSYLDQFKPNYHLLTLAGSSQGFKHSPETISKLKKNANCSTASDEQKLLTLKKI